jgi:hypothetical protein
MTIVFQGHVQQISTGNIDGKLQVSIVTEAAVCGQTITLAVDPSQAQHWMPGRIVSITAYTLPEPSNG